MPRSRSVERVEDLRLHLPLLQGASGLDQTVGERRLPVIDVGDDAEVADVVEFHKVPARKYGETPKDSQPPARDQRRDWPASAPMTGPLVGPPLSPG